MKLLTITPNPTIDRTLLVPSLRLSAVQRASRVHLAAGGKGLNVLRAARTLGVEALATGPLAGATGRQIRELAAEEEIAGEWYLLSRGESRNCHLIHSPGGDTTVINEPGPTVDAGQWKSFVKHCSRLAREAACITISGSFPPGSISAAGILAESLLKEDRPLLVDTSGPALVQVMKLPILVKVNQAELVAALGLGRKDQDLAGILQATRSALRKKGSAPKAVIVTLGGEGALWVSPGKTWKAVAPKVNAVSSVGSGDSFLAAVCAALLEGHHPSDCLRWGVAAGTANLASNLPARFENSWFQELLGKVSAEAVGE